MKLSCLENLIKIAAPEEKVPEYTPPSTGVVYPSAGSAYRTTPQATASEIVSSAVPEAPTREEVKQDLKDARDAVWNAVPTRQAVGRTIGDVANTVADTTRDIVSPLAWGGNGLYNLLTYGSWNGLYGPFGDGDTSRLTDGLATVPLAVDKINNRINTGVDRVIDKVNGTNVSPVMEKARNANHQYLQDSLYTNQENRKILSGVEDAQAEAYETIAALMAGGTAGTAARTAGATPAAAAAVKRTVPFLVETPYQAGIKPSYSATHDRFGTDLGTEGEYYTPWINGVGNAFKFLSPVAGGARYGEALEPLMYGITYGGGLGANARASDLRDANQRLFHSKDAPLVRLLDDTEKEINALKEKYKDRPDVVRALDAQLEQAKTEAAYREWSTRAMAANEDKNAFMDMLFSAAIPAIGEIPKARPALLAAGGGLIAADAVTNIFGDKQIPDRRNFAPYTAVLPNSTKNPVPIYASE